MEIQFTKMHGLGNDMIMIDNRQNKIKLTAEQVSNLCNRNFGIGADGLILLENDENADCFMNYHNADGSIGEMCGNGIRCTAKYFMELNNSSKEQITINTRAGLKPIQITQNGYIVNMGQPKFEHPDFPTEPIELENYTWHFASMGNPHAVSIVNQDPYTLPLEIFGPKIENNTQNFPNKINVEIVQIKDSTNATMRVWERGSSLTLACGSGACAVFAICNKLGLLTNEAIINLPGGNLQISYNNENQILMEGPAETIFTGIITI